VLQVPPSTAVPCRAAQASGVVTSHSISLGLLELGTQHAVSLVGGVGAHGFGSHEVACTTIPPAAAHSASVSSSHSLALSSSPV